MSPTQVNDFVRPNRTLFRGTVIASVITHEDEVGGPDQWTVLVLHREPPFYGLYEVHQIMPSGAFEAFSEQEFANIVPAVREYEQMGGDY